MFRGGGKRTSGHRLRSGGHGDPLGYGRDPDVLQFSVCSVCVMVDSVDSASAPASESSSPAAPEASALLVREVADGGAVLATGGVVDLPCIPPGQGGGQLLLHGTACTHILPGRALQSYSLSLLDRLPGQRDCALVRRRVVEEILDQNVDVVGDLQSHHFDLVLFGLQCVSSLALQGNSQLANVHLQPSGEVL